MCNIEIFYIYNFKIQMEFRRKFDNIQISMSSRLWSVDQKT